MFWVPIACFLGGMAASGLFLLLHACEGRDETGDLGWVWVALVLIFVLAGVPDSVAEPVGWGIAAAAFVTVGFRLRQWLRGGGLRRYW